MGGASGVLLGKHDILKIFRRTTSDPRQAKTSGPTIDGIAAAKATPAASSADAEGIAQGRLSAEAAEFKPTMRQLILRDRADYEDGEINSPIVAEIPKNRLPVEVKQSEAKPAQPSVSTPASRSTPKPESTKQHATSRDSRSLEAGRSDSRSGTPRGDKDTDRQRASHGGEQRGETMVSSGPSIHEASSTGDSRPFRALPNRPDSIGRTDLLSDERSRSSMNAYSLRETRDNRDARTAPNGRLGHPADGLRDRPVDLLDPHQRGRDRTPERMLSSQLEGRRHGPRTLSREPPPESGSNQDSTESRHRQNGATSQHGRERPPPSAESERPADTRQATSGSSADAPIVPSQTPINPQRAALIHGANKPIISLGSDMGQPPVESPVAASQRRTRGSSLPRDDRGSRLPWTEKPTPSNRQPEIDRDSRSYYDDRSSHMSRLDSPPSSGQDDQSRGPSRFPPSVSTQDTFYGRNSRGYGISQEESNYGRLNAPDTPTGPRMPSRSQQPNRGPQGFASGPGEASAAISPSQINDRPTPSGPAAGRQPPRLPQGTTSRPPSSSGPATPAVESPVAGVHPDRIRAIQGATGSSNGVPSIGTQSLAGPPAAAPRGPQSLNNGIPNSGGRGQSIQNGPMQPPPDRSRGDKRFAQLNTMLQQVNTPTGPDRSGQGTSIRGRGARNSLPQSPVTPGPPNGPFYPDIPPSRQDTAHMPRHELFGGQYANGPSTPQGPNMGHSGRRDAGGPQDARETRSSRHGSRAQSPARQFGGSPASQAAVLSASDPMRPPASRGVPNEYPSRGDGPPRMPERHPRRTNSRDDFGGGKEYDRSRGGGRGAERRDVRDVPWGGEDTSSRSDRRDGGGPMSNGPGSGRKRPRSDHEDYGEPKRSRRGEGH